MTKEKERYALVTGGSRGIGRAICVQLARQGYHILINFKNNLEAARATAAFVETEGKKAVLLPFDVADKTAVRQTLENWMQAEPGGRVDVLVNNAGVRRDTLMAFMEDEQWESVVDASLNGMYHVTRSILKPMLLNRYGRIINMVSLSGLKGMPGQVNYSAAKAGVIGATKALAQELAKRNITVNAIAPGFIQTDMTADLNEQELKTLIPMNRFGRPDEVAALTGFLVSPDAGYITGQIISINGGLYS